MRAVWRAKWRRASIPEIAEVEKLRKQLTPAWTGRTITKFSAPTGSPNPRKYAQLDWSQFKAAVTKGPIKDLDRMGKHLWVQMQGQAWHIHLSSTGWFMPANEEARKAASVDPIHENFLHNVSEENVRVEVHFDDGQSWNYHDPRTWGKWWLKPYSSLEEDPYFEGYGPDWLKEPVRAKVALASSASQRSLKEVLCDQAVTAGLGNYLACEAAHRSRLHPHTRFTLVRPRMRHILVEEIESLISDSMRSRDHSYWTVFDREGKECKTCGTAIQYAKDVGGKRGSYFCPLCQTRPGR